MPFDVPCAGVGCKKVIVMPSGSTLEETHARINAQSWRFDPRGILRCSTCWQAARSDKDGTIASNQHRRNKRIQKDHA